MKPTSNRIAILSHTSPSITRGGAEISAYTLYIGLRKLGIEAFFISACPIESLDKARLLSDDEFIIPYDPKDYDRFYHVAPPEIASEVESLVARLGCQTLLFHHFLFFGVNTICQLTERGYHVGLTLHEFVSLCYHHGQMVTRPQLQLCRESHPSLCIQCFPELQPDQFGARRIAILDSLDKVAAFISPSHFLAERCMSWGFPADRFSVIENGLLGVDQRHGASGEPDLAASMQFVADEGARHHWPTFGERDAVAPSSLETAPGRDVGGKIIIGFFGQLNPFKGLDILLDAAMRLAGNLSDAETFQFRIHGPVVALNEQLAARFDEAIAAGVIDYRGTYDNRDVYALMRECDFILMASRWWENSPVVIQEAFWARRPLIVPGIGGMAEKVQDGINGFHFRPGDGADLARVCRNAARHDPSAFSFPQPSSAEQMAREYLRAIAFDSTTA